MKKLLFALLLCAGAASSAFGQSNPPLRLQEIDGTPNVLGVTTIKVTNGTLSCSGKVCTITISGGGGGGTPGGANTQVQYNNAGSFGGAAGFTFNGTSTISLGVAGTSVGAIGFRNATSGTITLQPVTGALGTVTLSLPAVTDTLAGLAATQTLSNKTLASPSLTGNLSGATTSEVRFGANIVAYEDGVGPKFTDSNTGAMLTFDVQNLTASRVVRWPNVAGNAALTDGTLTNGNCAEFDASGRIVDSGGVCGGGGGGITVGTTTVTSGTATRLFYETAGNVVGQVSGATSDGTNITFGSGNLLATSPVFTTDITTPLVKSAAGAAIAVTATAPTATTGASQAGVAATLTASAAVASTDTAGAAAGGNVTITAGAAARLTSGNADGGNVFIVPGTGIGTGVAGGLVFGSSAASTNVRLRGTTSNQLFIEQANGAAGNNVVLVQGAYFTQLTSDSNVSVAIGASSQNGIALSSGANLGWSSSAGTAGVTLLSGRDLILRRSAAAHMTFGAADAASPVAQTLSVQNVVGGTSNTAGATWTLRASLGTGNAAPGRHSFTAGAISETSGTTQQTAVSRMELGATKVLTNNSATTIVNVTNASNTNAGGVLDYCVEVFDATELQYECGMVTYGVTNKGGVWSGNTATKFGNHQNATSGTLTVTFAISGANPALLSVNANSSLSPSSGFPRITYSLRNLGQQAIAIQ